MSHRTQGEIVQEAKRLVIAGELPVDTSLRSAAMRIAAAVGVNYAEHGNYQRDLLLLVEHALAPSETACIAEAHAVLDKAEISRKHSRDSGATWIYYSLAERIDIVCGALKMVEDERAQAPVWPLAVDRSEAVNLATNLHESGYCERPAGKPSITERGVGILVDAVLRMDAALKTPSTETEHKLERGLCDALVRDSNATHIAERTPSARAGTNDAELFRVIEQFGIRWSKEQPGSDPAQPYYIKVHVERAGQTTCHGATPRIAAERAIAWLKGNHDTAR